MYKLSKLVLLFCFLAIFLNGCNTDDFATEVSNTYTSFNINNSIDTAKSSSLSNDVICISSNHNSSCLNNDNTTSISSIDNPVCSVDSDNSLSDNIDLSCFTLINEYEMKNTKSRLHRWGHELSTLNLNNNSSLAVSCINDFTLLRISHNGDTETLYSIAVLGDNYISIIDDIDSY